MCILDTIIALLFDCVIIYLFKILKFNVGLKYN